MSDMIRLEKKMSPMLRMQASSRNSSLEYGYMALAITLAPVEWYHYKPVARGLLRDITEYSLNFWGKT